MSTFGKGIDLPTLAQRIFDGIRDHFAEAGVDLPERQYIAPGGPRDVAWDCPQFTVALGGIGWGQAIDASQPSPRAGLPMSVAAMRHAVFAIQIVRCTPVAPPRQSFPSVAELHAAGNEFLRDAGLLSQALVTLVAQLRQSLSRESLAQAGAVEPIGPDGGFHAVESTIMITSADLV